MNLSKLLAVVAVASATALFFIFDLQAYLNLEYLKSIQGQFHEYYAQNPVTTIVIYLVAYVIMATLSLPGAAIFTLAAGSFFGLVLGTILVSFASSFGATLAMLLSRWLFRDYVQERFESHIATINQGFEKEGAYYLFTIRLVPAIPFFVVNLAMGLVKIPAWTFYWVSQVGMLLGTAVYVNAGSELAKIETLADVASPQVLLSFALLGVLPIVTKKVLERVKG